MYPGGLSQARNTDFSFSEFGNEAQRYIERYRAVVEKVEEAYALIPERSRDAYFASILYPVEASAAMAEKMLYAQLARERVRTTYGPGIWKTDSTMMAAAAMSEKAYQKIRTLTRIYNEELAGGKWKGLMCEMPRHLYAFWAPQLPVNLTDAEIEEWSRYAESWKAEKLETETEEYYACNASGFSYTSKHVIPVQNLGHSGAAVPVEKGQRLDFMFNLRRSGKAILRIAVIPTQANDKGDIRFSVSIDGNIEQVISIKEPYRSDRWKENVMRGQALVEIPIEIGQGHHNLTFTALDDHIILDQWMVDFNTQRKFYMLPL